MLRSPWTVQRTLCNLAVGAPRSCRAAGHGAAQHVKPGNDGSVSPPPDDDLFSAALTERLARQAPLAARLRPTTLDEVVGQEKLIAPGKPLRSLIEADRLSSVILWGPPGTGKTTLARLIATATSKAFVTMSAVTAGVKDVREATEKARQRLAEHGQGTILFLDEVHRFNKAQQDALLPSVEEGLLTLIGATTENPYFEVNSALLSRSQIYELHPLRDEHVLEMLRRALTDERGVPGCQVEDGVLEFIAARSDGDARTALGALEVACNKQDQSTSVT